MEYILFHLSLHTVESYNHRAYHSCSFMSSLKPLMKYKITFCKVACTISITKLPWYLQTAFKENSVSKGYTFSVIKELRHFQYSYPKYPHTILYYIKSLHMCMCIYIYIHTYTTFP